jgi:diguanylate cyclase (GGDEF)-like protein
LDPSLTLPHGRPKLLIVDDQPTNVRVLHQLFRFECDVFMANSGEQAISVCRNQLPDLVLLDVVMDDIDGHEVCRRLKADPLTVDIPIIFITAKGEQDDEAFGLELGAVDFISKPFNPVIVQARVKTHLTLKLQGDYLRSLAMLDGLTGIANRRKFESALVAAWAQSCRGSLPLSVVMIDVDFFKRYNDRYGHQEGDTCLRRVAMALSESLNRPYDLVARYGGEEFVCILPGADLDGAIKIAQRLQGAVGKLGIEHAASDVAEQVTISLGVASTIPICTGSPQALILAADERLYDAKQKGRNQISSCAIPQA